MRKYVFGMMFALIVIMSPTARAQVLPTVASLQAEIAMKDRLIAVYISLIESLQKQLTLDINTEKTVKETNKIESKYKETAVCRGLQEDYNNAKEDVEANEVSWRKNYKTWERNRTYARNSVPKEVKLKQIEDAGKLKSKSLIEVMNANEDKYKDVCKK